MTLTNPVSLHPDSVVLLALGGGGFHLFASNDHLIGGIPGGAAATLRAAVPFGPLRRRVQGSVDRRLNRSRNDAERVAQRFAGRLRDDVDLDVLLETCIWP